MNLNNENMSSNTLPVKQNYNATPKKPSQPIIHSLYRSPRHLRVSTSSTKKYSLTQSADSRNTTHLSLEFVQLQVNYNALTSPITELQCEVILDDKKHQFTSLPNVSCNQTDGSILIPFNNMIAVSVDEDDSDSLALAIKITSSGDLVGLFIASSTFNISKEKGEQELPILTQDSKLLGHMRVKISVVTEGFFEDSASESSSVVSGTSTSFGLSPLQMSPLPFPSIQRRELKTIQSTFRSVTPVAQTYPTETRTNINQDFQEEQDNPTTLTDLPLIAAIKIIHDSSPTPIINEKIDSPAHLGQNDVSTNNKDKSSENNTTKINNNINGGIYWKIILGGIVVSMINAYCMSMVIIGVQQSIVPMPPKDAAFNQASSSWIPRSLYSLKSKVSENESLNRKKLIVRDSGLLIQLMSSYSSSINDINTNDQNTSLLYWKRGFFGEIGLFLGHPAGRPRNMNDLNKNSWWKIYVNPMQRIQLVHPVSEKCLCPISDTIYKTDLRRLRLQTCELCDYGETYGWTLDGFTGQLKYSSGSSLEFCLSQDRKNAAVVIPCALSVSALKTIISTQSKLSESSVQSTYYFAGEMFTDMNSTA